MGILEQTESRRRFTLGSRCLLGRYRDSDIALEDARVSGEHASLHWRGEGWEIRDLGSRNGTYVEGRRLTPGARVVLAPGQSFFLGHASARFQLVDPSPPVARARLVGRPLVREASGSLLLLPDDESPRASVFLDRSGHWVLESEEVWRPVVDQERLRLGEDEWVLELPTSFPETLEAALPGLEGLHLKIGVSRDEKHVVVSILQGHRQQVLAPRSHHSLLALLARLRLADEALPEAEQGWVRKDTLCQMLAMDGGKLNLDIHRVRRQLSTLGIQDAANLVQRRQGTGQIRLGVRSLEVFSL